MNFATSNLYQLFSSLTDNELKDIAKIVHSPFFNYREEEIKLFEYLLKTRKRDILPTGEAAVEYIFNEVVDLAKLRHVMTYLTRIITRYLVIHEMEESEEQKQLLLLRSLRKRNLPKLFLSNYLEAEKYIGEVAPLSPETYYLQLQLHTEYYTHTTANRKAQNADLQRVSDDLDLYYIIQKLKDACNILSYQNVFKFEADASMMNEALALIKRKNLLHNALARLLYFNYQCLSEPDNEEHFLQLKNALLADVYRIDIKELKDIFTLAINYCIKQLNSGKRAYNQHLFEIYGAGLASKVFEENGHLSPFTYKNIVAIAIGLSEYNWVDSFIEQYKEQLDKHIANGFYAYCKARYLFAIASYDKVIDLLQEVDIKEQFTELDTRILLVKTYYELNEHTLLDYTIDNLKQQLKRKNLQTYHAARYKNFAKMVSQLIHLRQYDKKAKQAFKEKIIATKSIAEKEWLVSKIG